MRRLLAARRELSIRGRIIEFCEIGEFLQKLKDWEKCINSSFWRSLGAIWIDSVSFEAFRSVSLQGWNESQTPPNLQSCE